ncbi:hypothetical protein J2848_003616 [Azospirillum lipoferum]|uniref:Uncharacterized protein n=1 Tax=Azospirillum lipoferum TaxID=193 RepID=A0A5A9GL48_AZOLI|nr:MULTISPECIES: hypothetical protein [Azospirillum]KAA0595190.1 hypothetical protein FZ942_16235 [Azospirillum lipoferum]MCP1611938.1 hypothetical protein [Azospirillum lipoferum]MDW5533303.1 hypothetical protein [Azospirillum sp. NL1]
MEPTTLTVLVVTASILSSVAVDVGVNTVQDWYDTFYQDAFWSSRKNSPELEAQLAKEEAEINRLIRESDAMNGAAPRL